MRYVLLLIGALVIPACGHNLCNDGDTHVTRFSSSYRSCNFYCVHGDKKGRVADCRCSAGCPCWQEADHKHLAQQPAVVVVPGAQPQADAICPKCQRSNAVGWNFCNTCGYKRP